MNCWDILGIEPTENITIIKRSYGKKLKIYHPEDDPQGFQRLREAYEKALQQAKSIHKDFSVSINENSIEAVIENVCEEFKVGILEGKVEAYEKALQEEKYINKDFLVNVNENSIGAVIENADEQSKTGILEGEGFFEFEAEINLVPENLVEQFMDKVKDLYHNTTLRNDANKWKKLLEDEVYWNLEVKQQLNYRMLNFLLERFQLAEIRLLPEVWDTLNEHFFWTEQEQTLYKKFPEKFLDFLMEKIVRNQKMQSGKNLNGTAAYPKYILYGNFMMMIMFGLWKVFSVLPQLGGVWLMFALEMFVGGLFWGGVINNKAIKIIKKIGVFDFTTPYCSFCYKPMKFRIPLIWSFLERKDCVHCGKKMLPHAFFTELLMGTIFFLTTLGLANSFMSSLKVLSVFGIMLLITIIDDISQLILDKLSLLLGIIGVASNLLLRESTLIEMSMGALLGGGILLLLAIISKGRIGGGVIKLAAAMGVVLGWKLMIIAISLVVIEMFITGILMMNSKSWLVVGSGILSGSGLIFLGLVIGWKLAITIVGVFVIGMFMTGINISFKARSGDFPVSPFFMTATHIALLHKETLSKFWSL